MAIERCLERGCGIVQLTTDKSRTDAHRFYERLGFRATHEGMKLTPPYGRITTTAGSPVRFAPDRASSARAEPAPGGRRRQPSLRPAYIRVPPLIMPMSLSFCGMGTAGQPLLRPCTTAAS